MQNETDFEAQINAVENFITREVDAIDMALTDSRAMVRPIKCAIAAGIKVVKFDVSLDADVKAEQGLKCRLQNLSLIYSIVVQPIGKLTKPIRSVNGTP